MIDLRNGQSQLRQPRFLLQELRQLPLHLRQLFLHPRHGCADGDNGRAWNRSPRFLQKRRIRIAGGPGNLDGQPIVLQVDRIGLPNIVAGVAVAPELLQGDLTPERLAGALAPWLDDAGSRARASAALGVVRERLGGPGASARAAAWLWEMCG